MIVVYLFLFGALGCTSGMAWIERCRAAAVVLAAAAIAALYGASVAAQVAGL